MFNAAFAAETAAHCVGPFSVCMGDRYRFCMADLIVGLGKAQW